MKCLRPVTLFIAAVCSLAYADEPPIRHRDFAFDDLLFLPLRLHVLTSESLPSVHSSLSDAQLARRVAGVNRIWSQAGVRVYVESLVREPAAQQRRFELVSQLGRPPLGLYPVLVPPASRAAGALDVYFVRALPVNGVYFGREQCVFLKEAPSLRRVPGGTDFPPERVFSHEIGHHFGLRHASDVRLLLASGTRGYGLSDDEVAQARSVARRRRSVAGAAGLFARAVKDAEAGRKESARQSFRALVAAPGASPLKARAALELEKLESEGFVLRDGDRVVLLGNAFIERARTHGYLETWLTRRFPGRRVRFRNLGWSGDDVRGRARAGFDPPAVGWTRLQEQVRATKPTVVLLGYGMNASFAGKERLPAFLKDLTKLVQFLETTGARVVLLSPIRHEDLGRPLPDPTRHNEELQLYVDAMRELASRRGHRFVDLFSGLGGGAVTESKTPLTDNGIHLTGYGYWRTARAVAGALGIEAPSWSVDLDVTNGAMLVSGTDVGDLDVSKDLTTVRFSCADSTLPPCGSPASGPPARGPPASGPPAGRGREGPDVDGRRLRVRGLAAGRHVVKVDGQPLLVATARELAAGLTLAGGPEREQVERLRQAVIRKTFLRFCSWRPQNNTYIYLFRKHEQGHLAKEIPDLEPLVAEREAAIDELKKPVTRHYEIVRED